LDKGKIIDEGKYTDLEKRHFFWFIVRDLSKFIQRKKWSKTFKITKILIVYEKRNGNSKNNHYWDSSVRFFVPPIKVKWRALLEDMFIIDSTLNVPC
jgi:hypothetical protein